ncbi:MAG: PKD domain-containing protein [Thermoplasmata archaeon]|nr:MAG: PKD domain-containing protein [Thermoplasmata archaeon]
MRITIILIISFLVAGLIMPLNSLSSNEADLDTRHQDSVTQFEGDIESKTLTFMGEGNDTSLVVALPEKTKVDSASVDIEGRPIVLEPFVIINYSDTEHNKAWDDPYNMEFPPSSPPSKFKSTPFTTQDYDDVKALDDNNKSTSSGMSFTGYPIQLYEFDLSNYAVLEFEVFWAGCYMHWWSGNVDGMNVSIWNVTANTWEIVGGYYAERGVPPTGDVYIEKSYTSNPLDFINSTSKLLYVIVSAPMGAGMSWCDLATNYISINITQDPSPTYPGQPYLNIGGDEDKEWTYTGTLFSKERFSGSNFKNELQDHLDEGTPIGELIYIPFEFGVTERGILYISNLTIVYRYNQGPTSTKEMPEISFDEDSGWNVININITSYFNDIDDPFYDLTFELNGNTPDIWGEITSDYKIKFTSAENFFGLAEFNISCRDKGYDGITNSDDCIIYSNNFTVEVFPTDDPPVIKYINDKTVVNNKFDLAAVEDKYLNFSVLAEDIDGDEITYSIDTKDESIALDGNKITFLPTQAHVGFFNFTLKATETNISKLYDFVNISILVENTNDGPVMEKIPDTWVVDEDSWLNLTLGADDSDLNYDNFDKITFKTNFSSYGIDPTHWSFDETSGKFSFKPDNSHVGTYRVNFSVADNYGEIDWCHIIIVVNNVNDPPEINPIEYEIVDADKSSPALENLTVTFTTVAASDPDIIHGDNLSYTWDFDHSDGISKDAEGLNVVWNYPAPGNYTVTLTVTDTGTPQLSNSTTITIQVLAPEVDIQEDDDNIIDIEKEEKEKGGWIWILVVLIVIIIIVVIFWFFIIKRGLGEDTAYEVEPPKAAPPVRNIPPYDVIAPEKPSGQLTMPAIISSEPLKPVEQQQFPERVPPPELPAPTPEESKSPGVENKKSR